MARYLITGAAGFVARHFIDHVEATDPGASILGVDRERGGYGASHPFIAMELMDYSAVERAMLDFRPTAVVHFASFSSVAESWKDPSASFLNNTNIFLNILESVRKNGISCRILSVGSSEQYGNVDPGDTPIRESHPMNPVSPYAVARVAQENLSRIYASALGLDVVITRSFNHIGPGQRPAFVVPSIIKQFLEGEGSPLAVSVGDPSIVRDFLDVRDVVKAYGMLLERGEPGSPYNVCSGAGISIAQVVDKVAAELGMSYEISIDRTKQRPSDNRIIVGDSGRLRKATGWAPSIPIETSIRDICEAMRKPEGR